MSHIILCLHEETWIQYSCNVQKKCNKVVISFSFFMGTNAYYCMIISWLFNLMKDAHVMDLNIL